MTAVAHQHVGLRVADIERAGDFYVEVFGAEWIVRPVTMGPPAAAGFMNGPPETVFQLGMVSLPGGAFVEFFQFDPEVRPDWVRENTGLMPHFGIQVDDVEATVARAEELGAKRAWPEIAPFGRARVMYMQDPDGNTIEVIDVPAGELVEDLLELFPEGVPQTADAA